MKEDITERKQIEEQLAQAQKMEAVGQLTGGVAHDFNNLLQVIITNLSFLVQDLKGDEEKVDMVRLSLEAAERGAQVTSGLLAFSRRQMLDARAVDVAEVVRNSVKLLRSSLGETVQIVETFAGDLPPALIDPGHLQNAIVNLAVNARDAMPEGGVLDIALSRAAPRTEGDIGDFVMISLGDDGVGIAPQDLERVIEPFFTTKGIADHSGLGLSMVHGFTQQSGGRFEIDSTVGRGTEVRLFLPVAAEPLEEDPVSQELSAPLGGSETILLVEDDQNVRRTLATVLERLGYELIVREDGAEGLKYLEAHEVDLLISDVVLPGGLSGPELAAQARHLHPHLKVVLVSGYTEVTGVAQEDMVLAKPVRGDKLAATVREVLNGKADER